MSKLLGFTLVLGLGVLGVVIASLVFNIMVYTKITSDDPVVDPASSPAPPVIPDGGCQNFDEVSKLAKWKETADRILATVDQTADPCQDFYQFSCGKYLKETDLEDLSRKGTYDEAQYQINLGLADYFDSNKLDKLKADTEKYQKNYFDACVADGQQVPEDPEVRKAKWTDLSKDLHTDLGFPLVGKAGVPKDASDLFQKMGMMERMYTGSPLATSFVTADFKNSEKNALYLNQPPLQFTRDYFVKPQYITNLQAYAKDIRDLILAYADNLGLKLDYTYCPDAVEGDDKQCAQQVAEWAVNLERSIAMASWPDTELRNYKQQYTPFSSLDSLDKMFKQVKLSSYVRGLLQMTPADELNGFNVVISQPTYFTALDGLFDSYAYSIADFNNYLAIHWLLDNAGEYGIDIPSADDEKKASGKRREEFDRFIIRRGHGARRIRRRPLNSKAVTDNPDDQLRTDCIDALMDYMPYGPGYTYVRNRDDKYDVRADAKNMTENIIAQFSGMMDSLDWIDKKSLTRAHAKSKELKRNYLWPDSVFGLDFDNFDTIDAYHHRYVMLGDTTNMTFWDILKQLKTALMATEQFDIVALPGDRENFLQSPAVVNAWYQPERNSITFPFGILNPPYYDLLYPQAYNYAGQGGTAGHELTHGYDDEGTQFDEFGSLAGPEPGSSACEFTHCSILDDDSRSGFTDMAQCVVQQFNSQCCPLKTGNVRCANGDTTQGENIADIGGEQAAYRAYNALVADMGPEMRLPGLERYSPQQIFWMTYGVSWCMKITDERLTKQLMTDPHAPSSCRVNQVMQDIPQFGMDFKCKRGASPMYPLDDDRCKVWVGF